jgi:hypothetical protein
LQKRDIFKNYFLVGGTALSLQLGHRISNDIDLFTRNDINKDEIMDFLNREYNGKYQIHSIQIKRSLVYFDDVTESNWSSVKLLKEKLSIEKIKQRIIKEVNNYNKIIIGNALE